MTKSPQEIAVHLDLANHHADATPENVKAVCGNVLRWGLNAAFVNPCYIAIANDALEGRAKVGTAVSFPLGQDTLAMKVASACEAVRLGADELDIVPNNGLLLTENGLGQYRQELQTIVDATKAARADVVVKFIIETGFLEELLIQRAAEAILASGADFIKICSGMGPRGASLDDVRLIKEAVGGAPIKIKVAGGIDTIGEVHAFLAAGADRIGTSRAVAIMEQAGKYTS
jgi:deoxyribose-phosphate aldolase